MSLDQPAQSVPVDAAKARLSLRNGVITLVLGVALAIGLLIPSRDWRPSRARCDIYHAIALWIPATIGTIAFILLQQTKGQPILLRRPREELPPKPR